MADPQRHYGLESEFRVLCPAGAGRLFYWVLNQVQDDKPFVIPDLIWNLGFRLFVIPDLIRDPGFRLFVIPGKPVLNLIQ